MSAGARWLDAPGEAAGWRGEPLGWLIDPRDPRRPGWLARVGATGDDLAAFAATRDAGARIERRRLTRLLLASATGCHPDAVVIRRDERGAPRIVGPRICVSVAGSRGWALIAIAADPVGADVEVMAADPPLVDMLTVDEAAAIRADPDPARAWLRHWVAKEAHAKRFGDPRRADPAAIAVAANMGSASSPQCTSRLALHETDAIVAAIASAAE